MSVNANPPEAARHQTATGDTYDIPRDRNQYGRTDHFDNRAENRTAPPITDEVVETCLSDGTIHHTSVSDRRFFKTDVPSMLPGNDEPVDVTWRLLVALDDAAFEYKFIEHSLLTAYAPEYHHDTGRD